MVMLLELEGERSVDEISLDEVRARLAANSRLRAWIDAQDLRLVARLERDLRDPVGPVTVLPEREIMLHAGLSSRDASALVGRAHTVDEIPALNEALASGSTTAGHVDAMSRGLKIAGADKARFLELSGDLVAAATRLPVGEFAALVRDVARSVVSDGGLATFERQRRSTYLKFWTDPEGMTQLRGAFDPERGALIQGLITREVERRFHSGDPVATETPMPWIEPNDHRAAIALVDLVSVDPSAERFPAAPRAEVVVHIPLDVLKGVEIPGSAASRTAFGAELPVETVRRMACSADIIPVVLDGASVPIDVGRSKRLATAPQRRALEAVHRTCAAPGCDTPYHHCQIHHIDYWESGGPTDLDNMVPLCSRHHHAAHEGGWTLRLNPQSRTVTFTPPGYPSVSRSVSRSSSGATPGSSSGATSGETS